MKLNEISALKLPQFILFKNLILKEDSMEFNITNIKSGEIVAIASTPQETRLKIPNPAYPTTASKIELFEGKYGDREDVDYGFNDSPYALLDVEPEDIESTLDFDIFDESYTILWVCPENEKEVVNTLIEHTIKFAKKNNRSIGDSIGIIWGEYIDSISMSSDNPDFDTPEFVSNIKQKYEELLSKLPDAPTKEDWDYLDEMLLK